MLVWVRIVAIRESPSCFLLLEKQKMISMLRRLTMNILEL